MGRWSWVGATKDHSSAYIVELRVRHLLTEGKVQGGGLLLGGGSASSGLGSARVFPLDEDRSTMPPHSGSREGHGEGGDVSLCPVAGGGGGAGKNTPPSPTTT